MSTHIDNWDDFWMGMAFHVARKSKDPSTKIGAVLVSMSNDFMTMGYNGFPRGVRELADPQPLGWDKAGVRLLDLERWEKRPEKYSWVEHGERNCVYNAARLGLSTIGAKLYVNANPDSICCDCARAIIQAGIVRVIGTVAAQPCKGLAAGHWHAGEISRTMLDEAGVGLTRIDYHG